MTLVEARAAIVRHLSTQIKDPRVVVYLGQAHGVQQIRGEHLVAPDGVIRLGVYGNVRIAGMTVPEAKAAIEAHLSNYLENPEVAVDIGGYNSKVYYIIFDGGGNGQQILRLPITGNDTVLDALSQSRGLPPVSSLHHIWVARPAPANAPADQVLPVDWVGITTRGRVASNYQLLPGDRIYVQAQSLITIDTALQRVLTPLTRILGAVLLGDGAYLQLRFPKSSAGGL
jgi:polysaccharide export outer membrane protein